MRKSFLALAASAAFVLAAPVVMAADYIVDGPAIVKAANWDAMETVTVELEDFSYSPQDLKLKAGQPYKLVIKNTGEKDHYYTAVDFFKNVAWRKVQTPKPNGAEIKAPYFNAIEVYKGGGTAELFFVPVTKGEYEVHCTIDDHKDKGMHGSITIE
jgi:uncharacterized cupredoxin-like copper-binding protein